MLELALNSKSLKQRHSQIYQELYSRCFLVVSTPVHFFWAGEYGAYNGAPLIGQNLPLRTYVGFERLKNRGKIEIVDLMYVPSKDAFSSQMDQIHRRKLEKYLYERAVQWLNQTDFPGIRIHSLSEVSPGCGLGASGAFASALSVAFQLEVLRVSVTEVQSWSNIPVYLLPQQRAFDRVHRLAWKISSILHDGISSGGASFMSLIGSVYPIVYYSEKRAGLTSIPADVRLPLNIGENYVLLDRLFYGGLTLDKLFNLQADSSWPVEFFLIYSGERGGGRAAKTVSEIDNELVSISDSLKRAFAFLKSNPTIFSPVFYQQALSEGWEGLHVSYFGMNATLSLVVLFMLKQLFELGGSERTVSDLCRSLNAVHDTLKILQRTTPAIDRISHGLQNQLEEKLSVSDIAVKLSGAGRGGDLLVVTPGVGALPIVQKAIKDLNKTENASLWLDYASSRDGFEEQGVTIEQHLSERIYSTLVADGSVLIDWYSKSGQTMLTLARDEFEKKKQAMPLLLDLTTNDIFIKGQQLTSKDLRSAKMTVAILTILLGRVGSSLNKGDLPVSSYTADRNELQSKIISPLQAVIQKAFHGSFPIKINGPLRQYSIGLDNVPFDIYVLGKRI